MTQKESQRRAALFDVFGLVAAVPGDRMTWASAGGGAVGCPDPDSGGPGVSIREAPPLAMQIQLRRRLGPCLLLHKGATLTVERLT